MSDNEKGKPNLLELAEKMPFLKETKAYKALVAEIEPEPKEEPQQETKEPQPDPLLETKKNALKYRIYLMGKLEKLIDEETEQVNKQTQFNDYLAVESWREVIGDYIQAVQFLIDGYGDSFTQVVKINGEKLQIDFEFLKNGKKIEPVNNPVAIQSTEGD
jgi:hypothetical protein